MSGLGRMALALLLAAAATGAPACQKDEPPVAPQEPAVGQPAPAQPAPAQPAADATSGLITKLAAQVEGRVERALNRPELLQAVDALSKRLMENPVLAKAGASLWNALGEQPTVAAATKPILDRLGTSKAMEQFVMRVMMENQGKNANQLEAAVSQKIDALLSSPAWTRGLDQAVDRLMNRPALDRAFERLADKLTSGFEQGQQLSAALEVHFQNDTFTGWLARANGGSAPDSSRAAELLADKALTEERIANLMVRLCRLEAFENGLGKQLAQLVTTPEFVKQLSKRLAVMLQDPKMGQRVQTLFAVVLGGKANTQQVDQALQSIFDLPVVERELVAMVDDVAADKQFRRGIHGTIVEVARDPGFAKLMHSTLLE